MTVHECPHCVCKPMPKAENGQTAVFIDHEGLPRYSSRFGFNAYGTVADVVKGFSHQRSRGATVYVYRLGDGLYDGSVVDDPSLLPCPGELVYRSDLGTAYQEAKAAGSGAGVPRTELAARITDAT